MKTLASALFVSCAAGACLPNIVTDEHPPVTDLRVEAPSSGRTLRASWQLPDGATDARVVARTERCPETLEDGDTNVDLVDSTHATLEDLQNGRAYCIAVLAVYEFGTALSRPATATATPEDTDAPPGLASLDVVSLVDGTGVSVSFAAPLAVPADTIAKFTATGGGFSGEVVKTVVVQGGLADQFRVEPAPLNAEVVVTGVTYDDAGNAGPSLTDSATVADTRPPPPPDVDPPIVGDCVALATASTKALVVCEGVVDDRGGVVQAYVARHDGDCSNDVVTDRSFECDGTFVFSDDGLLADQEYCYVVTFVDESENATPARSLPVRTLPTPEPTTALVPVVSADASAVQITSFALAADGDFVVGGARIDGANVSPFVTRTSPAGDVRWTRAVEPPFPAAATTSVVTSGNVVAIAFRADYVAEHSLVDPATAASTPLCCGAREVSGSHIVFLGTDGTFVGDRFMMTERDERPLLVRGDDQGSIIFSLSGGSPHRVLYRAIDDPQGEDWTASTEGKIFVSFLPDLSYNWWIATHDVSLRSLYAYVPGAQIGVVASTGGAFLDVRFRPVNASAPGVALASIGAANTVDADPLVLGGLTTVEQLAAHGDTLIVVGTHAGTVGSTYRVTPGSDELTQIGERDVVGVGVSYAQPGGSVTWTRTLLSAPDAIVAASPSVIDVDGLAVSPDGDGFVLVGSATGPCRSGTPAFFPVSDATLHAPVSFVAAFDATGVARQIEVFTDVEPERDIDLLAVEARDQSVLILGRKNPAGSVTLGGVTTSAPFFVWQR